LKKTDHPEDLVVEVRIIMGLDRKGFESVYSRIGYTKSPPLWVSRILNPPN